MILRIVIAGLLLWPLEAAAVELRPITVTKGTEGLAHVPVEITNASGLPIACTLQLAHWYSMGLGTTAPGAPVLIDLWFDKTTATYLVLNDKQENMPVEAAWCGFAGRAYETRAEIRLDRRLDTTPVARQIACSASNDRLGCK